MPSIPELYLWQVYAKGMTAGDIMLVHGSDPKTEGATSNPVPRSLLARGIVAGQSLSADSANYWRHAMRVSATHSHVYSQDWRFVEKPMEEYAGCILKVWHNPEYTENQRYALCQEAEQALGGMYDVVGLLGQLFRAIPIVGGWLGSAVEIPWLTYCSERICLTERTQTPDFGGNDTCQISPTDINHWCRRHRWEPILFRLKV